MDSSRPGRARALPGIAALGGMIVPALIYVAINWGSRETLRGWAILGHRHRVRARRARTPRLAVPASLKVFLTALAISTILGAGDHRPVLHERSVAADARLTAPARPVDRPERRRRDGSRPISSSAPPWFFVLRSGVHATLAGSRSPDGSAASDARAARGCGSAAPYPGARDPALGGLPDRPGLRLANAGVALAGLSARSCARRFRSASRSAFLSASRSASSRLWNSPSASVSRTCPPTRPDRSATGWRSCAASASR